MSTSTQEPISDQEQPENAFMEAFSETERVQMPGPSATAEELREAALKEASQYLKTCQIADTETDKSSWMLVRLMLRVSETFEREGQRDENAFKAFLDNHAGNHGNAKSDYHRLAKACMPKGNNKSSSHISKLGGAVSAMHYFGLSSANVFGELNKSLPIEGRDGLYSGVHRFFLEYRRMQREAKAGEPATNRFSEMKDDRLKKEAKLLLHAIIGRQFVPAQYNRTISELESSL